MSLIGLSEAVEASDQLIRCLSDQETQVRPMAYIC